VFPSAVCVYDTDFDYTFDPNLVDGPSPYPQTLPVPLTEPFVTRAVTGLRMRGYWADNEAGTFDLSNGTTTERGTTSADFDGYGSVADIDVILEPYGNDSSQTPETDFNGKRLVGYKLFADLETMPLIVDQKVEGTVAEVLTELADSLRGDFIWTFDTDSNGNEIVRFVQSGSRQSTQAKLEDYSIEKRVDSRLDEVRILGGEVSVDGEPVRIPLVDPNGGLAGPNILPDVVLDNTRLVEGSESVRNADTDETYERGLHYEIQYTAGELYRLEPARADPIPRGAELLVTYQFQPSATVTRDGATEPIRSAVVDELPLRSDRACRLAAQELLDQASSPTYTATAQLRGNTTYSVVAELASSRLPVTSLDTVDIEASPAGASVRLDAQESLDNAIDNFRNRIERVARYSR